MHISTKVCGPVSPLRTGCSPQSCCSGNHRELDSSGGSGLDWVGLGRWRPPAHSNEGPGTLGSVGTKRGDNVTKILFSHQCSTFTKNLKIKFIISRLHIFINKHITVQYFFTIANKCTTKSLHITNFLYSRFF